MANREGYTQLKSRILQARRVWKRTLALAGVAVVILGLIAMLVGEAIVDLLMPLPGAVRLALLIGIIAGLACLAFKYLIAPLRAKLTVHDVALNIEQKHPDLEDRLVSALQFGERETDDLIERAMLQRLVDDAATHAKTINFKATIDKSRSYRHFATAGAAVMGCILLAFIFPTEIHTTLNRLLTPWEKTQPVLSTKLTVEPGNARLLRGHSLIINVEVSGKSADKVRLIYTSPNPENSGKRPDGAVNMMAIDGVKNRFAYEIFNINQPLEYYVTANDTESSRYTVEVFDIPKVATIDVSYTYPEYTGLKPIVQQGDGAVRAVVGSKAEIRITTNKSIQSAMLTIEGKPPVAMAVVEGRTLTATLDVEVDAKYTVKLLCIDGFNNQTPIEYLITALPDQPPEIAIKKPGRDIKATKLEEIVINAEARDDYGVKEMAVKYSIGSGDPQELPMETVDIEERRHVSGVYTFYLEELDIEPGNVIYYYAQAVDTNAITGPGVSTTDIYLIEIRPFNERYEQMDAEQEREMQAETPESQAGQMLAQLAADQKQIIKETWRHIHSRPATLTEDYKAAVKQTGEKQSAFRDKVQQTVDQISGLMRTASVDPQVLMDLEHAISEMANATDILYAIEPQTALPHEQNAHELLVKVAMEIPKVLTQMRQGENQQAAEDIEMMMEEMQAEFEGDENELDDQIREQTQEMLDQAQEMLEQQRQLTQQSQQMGRENQPSQGEMQQNSERQEQLAQRASEMAQRAQQMSQQQSSQQQSPQQQSSRTSGQRMAQAGDAMQRAAEQMQSAAQNMQDQSPQMSAANGQRAEENVERAIEELRRAGTQATDRAVERATEQLERLMANQSDVQQQTQELQARISENESTPEDDQQASQLADQQRRLGRDLYQLQQNLSELQDALRQENPEARQNVVDAANRLIEEQVPEDMARAQRALQWRNLPAAEHQQQEVLDSLAQARDDLQQAKANLAETEEEKLETALEQLERLENQIQDLQREIEAMENQGTPISPELSQRQQQLAQQQAQIQQRMQQAMNAQQRDTPGENPQNQPGVGESQEEIKELWRNLLEAMRGRPSGLRTPHPNYDQVLRNLNVLSDALEDRLGRIQEKKRLAQVEKEDVPPEYRRLVNRYYESLAK